jgi:hypothetical protein
MTLAIEPAFSMDVVSQETICHAIFVDGHWIILVSVLGHDVLEALLGILEGIKL